MILDICFSPALYPYYKKDNDTVVVVDVFRASTTIITMLFNGAQAVIPVPGVEEARRYRQKGYLTGAERNAVKCDFADFGNSPYDYTPERVSGKEVVFTTSNGTQAIDTARDCQSLFIGGFVNIDMVARRCLEIGNRTVVLCAGWRNRINIEDTLFGGALAERISPENELELGSDAVTMAMNLWSAAKEDTRGWLNSSEHYQRLIKNNAEGDISCCLNENSLPIVPYLNKESGKLIV